MSFLTDLRLLGLAQACRLHSSPQEGRFYQGKSIGRQSLQELSNPVCYDQCVDGCRVDEWNIRQKLHDGKLGSRVRIRFVRDGQEMEASLTRQDRSIVDALVQVGNKLSSLREAGMTVETKKCAMLQSLISSLELSVARLGTLIAKKETSLMSLNIRLQEHVRALEQTIVRFSRGEFGESSDQDLYGMLSTDEQSVSRIQDCPLDGESGNQRDEVEIGTALPTSEKDGIMCGFLDGAEDPFEALKEKSKMVEDLRAQIEANKIEVQRKESKSEAIMYQLKSQLKLIEKENMELKDLMKTVKSTHELKESEIQKEISSLRHDLKTHSRRNTELDAKASLSDGEIHKLKNQIETLTLEYHQVEKQCETCRKLLDQSKLDLQVAQTHHSEQIQALQAAKSQSEEQMLVLKSDLSSLRTEFAAKSVQLQSALDRESLARRLLAEQKMEFEAEKEKLKMENEVEQKKIMTLQAAFNTSKSDLAVLYKDLQMAKSKLGSQQMRFENEKQSLVLEKEAIHESLRDTQRSLQEMESLRDEYKRSLEGLARRHEMTEEAKHDLEKLRENLIRELEEAKTRAVEKERELQHQLLQEQRKASESDHELKLFKDRVSSLVENVGYHQARELQVSQELATLVQKQREDFAKLSRENETLRSNYADMEVKNKWNEGEVVRLKESSEMMISELKKTVSSLQRDVSEFDERISCLKSTNQELAKEKSSLQSALKRSRQELADERESSERKEAKMKHNIEELQEEITRIRKKANELIQAKVNQIELQLKKIDELDKSLTLAASYEKSYVKLETELARIKALNARLSESNSSLSSEIARMRMGQTRRQAIAAALQLLGKDLVAQSRGMEALVREAVGGHEQCRRADLALREAVESLKQQLENTSKLREELDKKLGETLTTCEELSREVCQLHEANGNLRQETDKLKDLVDRMNKEMRAKEVEIEKMDREREDLQEKLVNEAHAHAETKAFLEKALDDVEVLEEAMKELRAQNQRRDKLFAQSAQSYKQMTSVLESELRVLSARAENVFDMNNHQGEDFTGLLKRFRDLEQTNELLNEEKRRMYETYQSLYDNFRLSVSLSARAHEETDEMLHQIDRNLDDSAACMLEKLLEAENQLQAVQSDHQNELVAVNQTWREKLDKAEAEVTALRQNRSEPTSNAPPAARLSSGVARAKVLEVEELC
eukprot:755029-Hanusia_phi.AAC.26